MESKGEDSKKCYTSTYILYYYILYSKGFGGQKLYSILGVDIIDGHDLGSE